MIDYMFEGLLKFYSKNREQWDYELCVGNHILNKRDGTIAVLTNFYTSRNEELSSLCWRFTDIKTGQGVGKTVWYGDKSRLILSHLVESPKDWVLLPMQLVEFARVIEGRSRIEGDAARRTN